MNSRFSKQSSLSLSGVGVGPKFSSPWTLLSSSTWFYLALIGLTIFQWILSGVVPLTEDELYYWTWAKALHWSFYDHPPIVAILIRSSVAVWGDSGFGIRFWGPIIHFIVMATIASLAPGKKILSLVLLTPLVLYGPILMTPDVPFLLFWAFYLVWLVSISKSFSPWGDDPISRVYRSSPIHWERWVLGGLVLGLGLLSKYSMVLAVPSSIMVLWTKYRMRSWWRGYLIHLLVAFVVASPIFIFNLQHQFVPLKFQWAHSLSDGSGVFGEFLWGQIALLGALPILMFGWVLFRRSDICSNPIFQVCFYCFTVPFLFSLFQSAKTHVEANWALMSYIAFWPLAQHLLNQNSIAIVEYLFLGLGFLPPFIVSILLGIHLVHPVKWISPEKDRLAKYEAQIHLAQTVKQDLEMNGRTQPLYLPTYQWTSYFRFLS